MSKNTTLASEDQAPRLATASAMVQLGVKTDRVRAAALIVGALAPFSREDQSQILAFALPDYSAIPDDV